MSDLSGDNVNTKLQKLASKQQEWSNDVSPVQKLHYIQDALDAFVGEDFGLKGLKELGEATADMKHVSGEEREYVCAEEAMFMASSLKGYLEALRETFRVRTGQSEVAEHLKQIPTRSVGDQVVADVFPLTPADKAGPMQNFKGEVWFEKNAVTDPDQVKPFQFELFDDKKDGVKVVLGAGNYSMLTVLDCLFALFVKNQVVFVKHHPLRPWLDGLMRSVLASLYKDGFLDSEVDLNPGRSSEIVNSPYVTSIHMTGGKSTHDAIVFGSSKEEQERNKANHSPQLKNATMTSELGCVTPFFVTPEEYSPAELEHQAQVVVSAKWINGSASCNAPQVIIVAASWPQRRDFVSKLVKNWEMSPSSCTYYPGAGKRWEAFKEAYPSAILVHGRSDSDIEEENDHLPLLFVEIDVDMSTETGRQKAKTEYGFRTEAFTPVLVVVTIKDDGPQDFMVKAVDLGNNYIFGSLSCSLAVPASADGSEFVEQAIANLKYGSIVLNAWSAQSYGIWSLCWGAFPGEPLEQVESGIGKVINALFLPHVEKVVLRTPTIDDQLHFVVVSKPLNDVIDQDMGIAHFVMSC